MDGQTSTTVRPVHQPSNTATGIPQAGALTAEAEVGNDPVVLEPYAFEFNESWLYSPDGQQGEAAGDSDVAADTAQAGTQVLVEQEIEGLMRKPFTAKEVEIWQVEQDWGDE